MALPLLSKTWEPHVNQLAVADGDEYTWHRKMLLACKNLMIGFSNNPWIVAGSSDGSTAGMDSVDRWSVFTDLDWIVTGAHSWIVLERVDGVQVCFDLFGYNDTLSERCKMYWSAGGNYTGGTTTAKPTATDEANMSYSPTVADCWMGNQDGTGVSDNRYHFWHSTDGLVTRAIFYLSGVPHTIWRFERLQNPRTNHTVPVGCVIHTSWNTSDVLTVTKQEDEIQLYIRHGAVDGAVYPTGVGYAAKNLTEKAEAAVAEEIDSELWFTEIGYSSPTIGMRGPKGKAFDMWWGQHQVVSDGHTYPDNAAAREFVQFGCFVFPWTGDSTVPLIA